MDREESLVRRAVQGDAVGTTLLLKDSRRWLCAMIAQRIPASLRGLIDADDVVQEAHVEVFKHVADFEWRGPGSFHRWVLRIARRKLRAAVRAQHAQRRGGAHAAAAIGMRPAGDDSVVALLDLIPSAGQTPSRLAARLEGVQAVQDVLKSLPDHYQRALQLVYVEGRPVADAATAMHCSDRAVHGYCRRGLRLLREGLGARSRFLSSTD